MPSLLGAVVDQPVLADVQVSRAGAALPVVHLTAGEVFLEPVDAGITVRGLESFDLLIHAPFTLVQRLQSAGMVVNDAHGTCESKSDSALGDRDRVFRDCGYRRR